MIMNEFLEKIRAERQAWKAAYDAADEETRKTMLEERVKSIKENERKRQERISEDRKARFMKRSDEQIDIYNELETATQIALEHIKKFDGKVLNNRLTNSVEKELKNASRYLCAKLDVHLNYATRKNVYTLELKRCYSAEYDCQVEIKLSTDRENRLLADETMNGFADLIPKKIENILKAKDDYDAALNLAHEIYSKIEIWGKDFHYSLRDFLNRENTISNKYYL